MSDKEKSIIEIENAVSSLNIDNNDIPGGSMRIRKTKNAWSIVHFESDEENCDDGFNDLIPSSWIDAHGVFC